MQLIWLHCKERKNLLYEIVSQGIFVIRIFHFERKQILNNKKLCTFSDPCLKIFCFLCFHTPKPLYTYNEKTDGKNVKLPLFLIFSVLTCKQRLLYFVPVHS